MSGLSYDPELADTLNDGYVTGSVSVTSTQVEAKVGASRLAGREMITIQNTGSKTVYYGPTGVTNTTGSPLLKDQFVSLPIGASLAVFVICASGDTSTVIVQEIA